MIGIDLGGSNLRAAVFDAAGREHGVIREPVGEPRDPATIVERVARVVEQLAPDGAVGIGVATMLRGRDGLVANSPHLRWRDVPLGELLAARLGLGYRLGVYNDANAMVWGETCAGAARGCRDVLGVFVGTGIGGGLVCDGRLVDGATGCAGEVGHVKVRWGEAAAPCACGNRGCLEAYCGGSYVLRRIHAELAAGAWSSALARAGDVAQVHPGHVDAAAADGDAWALGLWSELAVLLAVALGNAVALTNPERLVLGGGLLSRAPALYQRVVAELAIAGNAPSLDGLAVMLGELGDVAGLVGAARLAEASPGIIRR